MEALYAYQSGILTGYHEVVSSLNRAEKYKTFFNLRAQETEILLSAVSTSNYLYAAGYASYLEFLLPRAVCWKQN